MAWHGALHGAQQAILLALLIWPQCVEGSPQYVVKAAEDMQILGVILISHSYVCFTNALYSSRCRYVEESTEYVVEEAEVTETLDSKVEPAKL